MRDWFVKDFHWKAFSLLMAIGIWLTVRKEAETPTAHGPSLTKNIYGDVPVLAVSGDANVSKAQLNPQTVNITVSGPADTMGDLNASQIHAFVNLSGLSTAQNLPRDIDISLPAGVNVVDVEPPQVSVTITKQP